MHALVIELSSLMAEVGISSILVCFSSIGTKSFFFKEVVEKEMKKKKDLKTKIRQLSRDF